MNLLLPQILSLPEEIVSSGLLNSWIMISAAVLLWITFVIFGIIARRYETVLRKKTEWQFILAAPSGILIYALLKLYSSVILGEIKMGGLIEIIGYGLFFISGILSLLGALRFRSVVSPRKGGRDED